MHQALSPPPIQALLRPRAIALVGVSAKGGAGANILRSGQRFGFAVPTWPVNPNATEIDGQRCYKSLAELPYCIGESSLEAWVAHGFGNLRPLIDILAVEQSQVREFIQGVQVSAPFGNVKYALEVFSALPEFASEVRASAT